MSGLEIAGLVLGALPLAIEVLDRYGEVARRIDVFFKIRTEYQEWRRQLKYNNLLYERNLKELLLPLMIDDETEKDKIPELIKDPFGSWWTEPKTARLLQERLDDGYEVYMDCIQVIKQVMEDIVHELALGHSSVQSKITTPGEATMIARLRDSDNRSFQRFRFKFAVKGQEKRTRLFSKFEDYNRKLRDLLEGSDKLRDLSVQTPVTVQPKAAAIDTALCKFWVKADKFFNAIASSWNCRCNTHCANLLLRHRSNATPEFEVLFTKEQPSPATWNARKTKIVGKQGVNSEPEEEAKSRISLPIHTPSHKDIRPLKSALGKPEKIKRQNRNVRGVPVSQAVVSTTTVTLVEVKQEDKTAITSTVSTQTTTSKQIIHCLCTALEAPASPGIQGEPSYGYLINDDISYHIYDLPYEPTTQQHTAITLQNIIDGDLFHILERKQRYSIALTIASSFVQLLDSPWLPTTLTKTDIIFLRDSTSEDDDYFLDEDEPAFLNEPYVQQKLTATITPNKTKQETVPIGTSLDQLGIILLELCFGKRLKDQPCRRRYDAKSPATNDHVRAIYDVAAARDWQRKVQGEAGSDYASAVDWCLGGNRGCSGNDKSLEKSMSGRSGNGAKGAVERWRKDMLNNVVGRLKSSVDYLAGKGVED
ncbi:LOW QUALITY PROTEIN: hypothetical protein B0H65DRAFT_511117 [Neurospora tetraspora]|uniref:DUF7580 domain-containing protein n=1 Tax=Neurospora tetraspora TaxID=94610 RepID=A0AAE0J8T1_9PEZI|nr:LOW QUALITY PROTEIN: hypothetical protein B0H65DRAFT_511117 [Neurospora tetraspora]